MTGRPAILIVEDEAIVAHDLQQTLREHGYDAFAIASSAEEALARAESRCPDLVLMDIRIEGQKDGVSTARTLQERFRVPVIYLTAHADDATIERAKTAEPSGYLLKPIRPAELKSSIEMALHRHLVDEQRGLGLWTCLGIVNAAGGTLSAHSEPGRGSRLTALLPAAESGARRAVQALPPPSSPAPASKRRILVIDDEPMLLRSMRRMLQEHDVVCAESAREGLDLLATGERFDLIVSDLMMPGMNGIDLYEELVKIRPDDARRVVFVTGGALGTKANAFLRSLPNTRIEKPFAVDDLRRTIHALLEP